MALKCKIGTFKDKPVFEIHDTERKPREGEDPRDMKPAMSFGLWKAGMIVEVIDQVKAFVDSEGKELK